MATDILDTLVAIGAIVGLGGVFLWAMLVAQRYLDEDDGPPGASPA